ncbi:MAG: HAD family phosphatase [Nanoarchaeota archaeon]|nr:HAD family phosphatase [Nanoarchaeota archaeon]
MIKGIIFDMDGVIIDSNHFHFENWQEVFEKRYHVKIDEKEFASRLGESGKHFTEYFLEKYKVKADINELYALLYGEYMKRRDSVKLKPGVIDTLKILKPKYKIALATGADKEGAAYTIVTHGLTDYFDFVIGGNEVKRAKPDPEIFLKAAEMIKIPPEQCCVIEDAVFGLSAAKSAGMLAISIPDKMTLCQDHSIADIHLNSIKLLPDALSLL